MEFVHVAGTNGKGSVSLMMQRSLQTRYGKVGLFTSPHLFCFCERIVINDRKIDREYVAATLPRLFQIGEQHSIPLTFFDYITALSLLYYRDHGVKHVVLETGLGGRLDATNVVSNTRLSIITSISYDHQNVLGHSLREIAYEKAGIIKENSEVLLGYHTQPKHVFVEEARLKQATLYQVTHQPSHFREDNWSIVQAAATILGVQPV